MSRESIQKDVFSEKHVKEEEAFKKDIESYWDCKLEKLPIDYRLDYAVIMNGKIRAWIELKNRNLYSNQYKDSMINLNKWMKAKEFKSISDLPIVLAVRYKDKDLWCAMDDNTDMEIRWGARTKNTRDWQDVGPAVHIKLTEFKEF